MRVLVTGGSRGLGAELCRRFAAEGGEVVLQFRAQKRKADAVAAEVGGTALQADLSDLASLEALVEAAGPLDVLVNNAARTRGQFFPIEDPVAWAELVQTNLIGTAQLTRAVVRSMVGRGGSIVNISSALTGRAVPGQSAYAVSKGGLEALTRALGAELAPRQIRVNAVVPGMLDVGMGARMPHDQRDRWLAGIPMGRAGTAGEVADAVWFLSQATYITGQCLRVDGGLTL